MENSQIVKPVRYRAYVKEVEGIDLYWIPELKVTGLHQRGLAKMIGCDEKTVRNAINRVKTTDGKVTELVEIQTEGGLQGADLIPELVLSDLLEDLAFSKASLQVRKNTMALFKRLATVGFKLMAMYHVAPEELFPEIKPEPRALSPGRAAILAAGDDPIAIAKASYEHFPDLATSRLPVEVHAAQIAEVWRYVGR